MKLHERVKYYRKINKLSQVRLAEKSGLSLQVIRDIESGDEQILLNDAADLARALGTTIDALWYGTDFQALNEDYDRFRALKRLPYRDLVSIVSVMDHFLDGALGASNWRTVRKPLKAKSVKKK